MLAQDLVQRDGPVDGGDAVFGDDDDVHTAGLQEIRKVTDERVDVTAGGIATRDRKSVV